MTTYPNLHGLVGKAYDVTPEEHEFTIASWFMLCPAAHPLWDWYFVCLVHLRGEADGKPPELDYPEATHEVMIFALDSTAGVPIIDKPLTDEGIHPAKMLTPQNLCKQFHGVSDEEAIETIRLLMKAFVSGRLSQPLIQRRRIIEVSVLTSITI